jgi:hypothetical protein
VRKVVAHLAAERFFQRMPQPLRQMLGTFSRWRWQAGQVTPHTSHTTGQSRPLFDFDLPQN